jgi:hypothetical protein
MATAVTVAALSLSERHDKSAKKAASSLDLGGLRERVFEATSCARTFPGGVPPAPCVNNTYVDLRSESNNIIVAAAGSVIGLWTVRAKCNTALGRIELRSARLNPGAPILNFPVAAGQYNPAHYVADEMGGVNLVTGRQLRYDWEHPRGDLIEPGRPGLCSDWFAPPVAVTPCPVGQILTGYNVVTKQRTCSPFVANCSGDQLPRYINDQWVCQRAIPDSYVEGRTNGVMTNQQGWITNTMTTTSNNIINAVVPGQIDTAINNNNNNVVIPRDTTAYNNANSYTQNRFSYMANNGDFYEKWGDGDSYCALLNNTTCPSGYYLMGVEFKVYYLDSASMVQAAGTGCRIRCRRIFQ